MMARRGSATRSRKHRSQLTQKTRGLEALESRLVMAAGPELWFYVQTNLAVASNVTSTKALIDRAAVAGYTYMMLADTKLSYDGINRPGSGFFPSTHLANLRNVIAYASSKGITFVPATFELGRGDWVLTQVDENLVEGQSVVGTNFTVNAGGTALTPNPQNPTLNNPSFTSSASWSLDSGRAFIDNTTGHTDTSSLKIGAGGGRGLAIQTITLIPHRQYHVSYWVKSSGFSGDQFIKIYDPSGSAPHFLEDHQYEPALTSTSATWVKKDYVFNSGNSTSVQFRVGSWGNTSGTIWFDDVAIEEIALHNVVRNSASNFKLYRPDGTVLTEGVDYNPVKENWTINSSTYALYRTPLTVTIPAGSALHAGDQVKIDYDAAQPVDQGQYSLSNTPAMQTYYGNVMQQLRTSFANGTPVMVGGYDEIRVGNSQTGEYAAGLTAGQSLAQSFLNTYNKIRSVDPTTPIYTWSDMFDPNHNAKNNYYNWNGDLSGSWATMPDDVTIMNWNLGNLNTSLRFFSGLGNQQIIAGYYSAPDGFAKAQSEVASAVGAAGVRGLMFTVWNGVYTELEDYAAGAKAAWASLITPPTITGVFASSSSWNSTFLADLSARGLGSSTYGYNVSNGANQLRTLPWNNVNKISVQFSEPVVGIAQSSLALTGLNVPMYAISGFSYDAANRVATWTINQALAADALTLTLNATNNITDSAGNPLDGEWTNGVSTVSGNGLTGGAFSFRMNVLPGDVDNTQGVNLSDTLQTYSKQALISTSPGYSNFHDINGDAAINLPDTLTVRSLQATVLPGGSFSLATSLALAVDEPVTATPLLTVSSDTALLGSSSSTLSATVIAKRPLSTVHTLPAKLPSLTRGASWHGHHTAPVAVDLSWIDGVRV